MFNNLIPLPTVSESEQIKRSFAWLEAINFYIDNGTHEIVGDRIKRCIETNRYVYLDAAEWIVLKIQYPAP